MFIVYILYSYSLKKFYTGFTSDIIQRMTFHNSGANHFTKKGTPWIIVATFEVHDKLSALALEQQINKNGAKRFLERNNITFSI